jgi:hypothetical protein
MLRLGQNKYHLHILAAIVLGGISRFALFFGSMAVPIPNEQGLPVSPLTANSAIDLGYYLWARDTLFGESQVVIEYFRRIISGDLSGNYFLPGPIFPGLLQLFDYGPDHTIALSSLYLILSIILVTVWLWWLGRNKVAQYWLYVFALLPTPYWFMLNVSTDLLFALIICAFWLLWFDKFFQHSHRMIGAAFLLILAALLRPNSMSLLLFMIVDITIWEIAWAKGPNARRMGIYFAAFILVLTVVFAIFFSPYFWIVVEGSSIVSYFGVSSNTYVDGLWPALPDFANLGLSWIALFGAKMLYASGIRPSFGDTLLPLVFLRMLPGLVVLPGLFWVFVRASWRERVFVSIFLAPIILGVTQDRYVLPIQPILFFYGTKAWRDFIQSCVRYGYFLKRSKINFGGNRGSGK